MEQDKKDKPVDALDLSTGTITKHGNGNGNWASQTCRIYIYIYIVLPGPIQKRRIRGIL